MSDYLNAPRWVSNIKNPKCANCHKSIKEVERRIAYTSRTVIHEKCKHMAEEYAQP